MYVVCPLSVIGAHVTVSRSQVTQSSNTSTLERKSTTIYHCGTYKSRKYVIYIFSILALYHKLIIQVACYMHFKTLHGLNINKLLYQYGILYKFQYSIFAEIRQILNMEIILKWVQTAILTTISNLLYAFCITRLNTMYLFIFVVYYYCFRLINMLQNVQNPMGVFSKFPSDPHKCRSITIEYITSQ